VASVSHFSRTTCTSVLAEAFYNFEYMLNREPRPLRSRGISCLRGRSTSAPGVLASPRIASPRGMRGNRQGQIHCGAALSEGDKWDVIATVEEGGANIAISRSMNGLKGSWMEACCFRSPLSLPKHRGWRGPVATFAKAQSPTSPKAGLIIKQPDSRQKIHHSRRCIRLRHQHGRSFHPLRQ